MLGPGKMRKAAAITLGLIGMASLTFPGALLLWAHHQYIIGLSVNVVAMSVALAVIGITCILAGYAIMRH
jgi:hypothetical protein